MESRFHRFWRYDYTQVNFIPLDDAEPRQGGKVKVNVYSIDFRTLTPQIKTLYGIYSDDFITFGQFPKSVGDPLNNDEVLLKVVDSEDRETVPDRFTFRFENNALLYKREVNGEVVDAEIEHEVKESQLIPLIDQTWSETLFYGLGNKRV